MNEDDVKRMKVSELKEALASRGLGITGRKDDLVARLLQSLPSGPRKSPSSADANTSTAASSSNNNKSSSGGSNSGGTAAVGKRNDEELLKLDPLSVERLRARRERFGTTCERLRAVEETEARAKRSQRFSQR